MGRAAGLTHLHLRLFVLHPGVGAKSNLTVRRHTKELQALFTHEAFSWSFPAEISTEGAGGDAQDSSIKLTARQG